MSATEPDPDGAHWSHHVRMFMYVAFLPAIAFLGPLVAIAVFAVIWTLLPEPDSDSDPDLGSDSAAEP